MVPIKNKRDIIMLRISKLADYATMIMVHIAHMPNLPCTAKSIAQELALQEPTVRKILKCLLKKQLLTSVRGVQGGYQLERSTQKINIADIIAALDGPIALTDCSHEISHCDLVGHCATKHSWQLINKTIYQALASISLADMQDQQFLSHMPSSRGLTAGPKLFVKKELGS